MFEVRFGDNDEILMIGRCDAAQEARMLEFFAPIAETRTVECGQLEYISSSGLGVLFATQARLRPDDELIMANLSPHLRDVFQIAGFNQHFTLAPPEPD